MMLSVGRLARRFGLSRSTLLYYDRIGLLAPSARSGAGYRVYDAKDCERLEAICRYRAMGLGLKQIGALLDAGSTGAGEILERRLDQLNQEIAELRGQQRVILQLLSEPKRLRKTRTMDKQRWVKILEATGLDDAGKRRWHTEFERMAPEAHQDFLESLGIDPKEVRGIRRWSRAHGP